ncbi:hypothetical protein SDRG_10196 [Saprolegnia diclina VS20]|uniref:C2H2-type domain-containing protein n=1 Tax=Saprolegnia diclina (strain VS20) TaxID=1156394 RepID=T0QBG4_SAPDV|nr:hypothetical protein SDRG_10196 [Saprolegnia diclina VS20]EQC31996.1 hypothetical protein SDRG_10196 [Saprolegnia diclina VS20]|eukprot:XP_008614398.1 hypothetical protein SDRG_10196 [Saprolegnia diclina VS20]
MARAGARKSKPSSRPNTVHVTMDSDGLYSCPDEACAYRAEVWRLLYQHVANKHDDFIIDMQVGADATVAIFQRPNRELQCPKCTFRSASYESVKQHINSTHAGLGVARDLVQIENRPAPFRCPDCSTTSIEWSKLQKHCASRHKRTLPDEPSYALPAFDRTSLAADTPVYDCPKQYCSFETSDLSAFQEHLKVVHPSKKRKMPDLLPRYLVPPEGPYTCPVCKAAITCWSTLLEHVAAQHHGTFVVDRPTTCKGRELRCPVASCGYKTTVLENLAAHCQSVHSYSGASAPGVTPVVPTMRGRNPVYACPLCSFETGLAASLRFHSEDAHQRKVAIQHAPATTTTTTSKQLQSNAVVNAAITNTGDFRILAPVASGAEIIFELDECT